MILLSLLAQATEPTMSSYDFWITVIDRLLPILTPVAIALAAYLTWLTKRDLSRVEQRINGRMTELLAVKDEKAEMAERAGHAEGKLEAQNDVPPVPPVIVVPTAQPPARTGLERTRRDDREPPAEPDPRTLP